jgi:hypothetical protein
MGWLNFDSGVNWDQSTGYITGYAWSSNYGWLKFGGLSGFPSSGGNAQLVGSNMNGWARFCSAVTDPINCTGNGVNFSNGGWDGWVNLNGVSISGNNFSGYAWGGSDVVGWIDFSGVSLGTINDICSLQSGIQTQPSDLIGGLVMNGSNTDCGCPAGQTWDSNNQICALASSATLTLNADPANLSNKTTLYWYSGNTATTLMNCTATSSLSTTTWSGNIGNVDSHDFSPYKSYSTASLGVDVSSDPTIYSLRCTDVNNNNAFVYSNDVSVSQFHPCPPADPSCNPSTAPKKTPHYIEH